MIRSIFSILGLFIRVVLVLILIVGLVFAAFVVYKGSQPMMQAGVGGMTYWQFMRERIGAIHEMPAKCLQMHFTGYVLAVPLPMGRRPQRTVTQIKGWKITLSCTGMAPGGMSLF